MNEEYITTVLDQNTVLMPNTLVVDQLIFKRFSLFDPLFMKVNYIV